MADRGGIAQELPERLRLEIVDRVHRHAEIGTLCAFTFAVKTVAGHADGDEAVEAATDRIGGRDARVDAETRPALEGAVSHRERGKLIGPVFAADLRDTTR